MKYHVLLQVGSVFCLFHNYETVETTFDLFGCFVGCFVIALINYTLFTVFTLIEESLFFIWNVFLVQKLVSSISYISNLQECQHSQNWNLYQYLILLTASHLSTRGFYFSHIILDWIPIILLNQYTHCSKL